MTKCTKKEQDFVLLRVNGEWIPYNGTTSLRKIYYRASGALWCNSCSFYVYEFGKVTGAIFPNNFHRYLSCTSINGVQVEDLPHMILLGSQEHTYQHLGDGSGKVCTYCGHKEAYK